jgi:hypothetical protein
MPHFRAPPNYLVFNSPNEEENGTYMCPHPGCDGVTLVDAEECCQHEEEWHKGSYARNDCSVPFAAWPALHRHIKASGHEAFVDTVSETFSGSNDSYYDGEECEAVCCQRFQTTFATRLAFQRHLETSGHIGAVKFEEELKKMDLTQEEMEEKINKASKLCCDVEGCSLFEVTFSSAHSYFHHCNTKAHKRHMKDEEMEGDEDGKDTEEKEVKVFVCTVDGCRSFGREFKLKGKYVKHCVTITHQKAQKAAEAQVCLTRELWELHS